MEGLAPGTVVAGYRIQRRLGTGRVGAVYAARHPRLPRDDALKILTGARDSPRFRARFLREADIVASLDHPNVVTVHDRGASDGLLWIAMQLVDGYDAATLIERHPQGVPAEAALAVIADAARGLDAAHRAGLVHRDVKPANLLIEPAPDGFGRTLVTDFGIARGATEDETVAASGALLGTPAYIAPEQIRGGHADRHADVYSLGCTLYHLLTGSVPYPRETAAAALHAHLHTAPPRPSRIHPTLPRAIDEVVRRALAKDPAERYDSCGALAAAAAAALAPGGTKRTAFQRPSRSHVRSRARPLVIGVLLVLLVAVLAVIALRTVRSSSGSRAAPVPTTAATATASTWGAYTFMVRAFPDLLPASPAAVGYQGLRCAATDEHLKAVSVDTVGATAEIHCGGNAQPIQSILLHCNSDRAPLATSERPQPPAVGGEEDWSRPSGTGHLVWGTDTNAVIPFGQLLILFDNPARSFCWMYIAGGKSGEALRDDWWPTTPL